MNANIDASVGLSPKRSQIFVITLAILSGVAFLVGSAFLWNNKSDGWISYLFSIFFGLGSGYSWFLSYRTTDLHGGHPTRISVNQEGTFFEADSRTLATLESFQVVERFLAVVGHRAPLPEPDGMVSPDGKPQPERKSEAVRLVGVVNEEANRLTSEASLVMARCLPNANAVVPQIPVSTQKDTVATNLNQAELKSDKNKLGE